MFTFYIRVPRTITNSILSREFQNSMYSRGRLHNICFLIYDHKEADNCNCYDRYAGRNGHRSPILLQHFHIYLCFSQNSESCFAGCIITQKSPFAYYLIVRYLFLCFSQK